MARMTTVNPYNKYEGPTSYPVGPSLPQMKTPPSWPQYPTVVDLPRPGAMLAFPMMKMLLKGGKSVPKVPLPKTKRMVDVAIKAVLDPTEGDVVSNGIQATKTGPMTFPGMTRFTCATNTDPQPNGWISWRAVVSPSCGVGFLGTGAGTGSGWVELPAALDYINKPTPSAAATLWQVNSQNGLGGGRRRKHEYRRAVASKANVPLQALGPEAVGVPAPSMTPGMSTPPRTRGGVRSGLRGYERAATTWVLEGGGGKGNPPKVVTKYPDVHRVVPTKSERKTLPKAGALLGAYHKLTEINDLFDSLADAIPGKPCSKLPGFSKMLCVVAHWDEIDPIEAAKNIAMNEIEDKLVAKASGQLGEWAKAGGPSTTQMNQFLRGLAQLI